MSFMDQVYKKQKIAFYLPSLHLGGGEKAMLDIARFLSESGVKVFLLAPDLKGPYADLIGPGIEIVPLGNQKLSHAVGAIASYLRKEKPDTLFSTSEHAHIVSFFARMCARTKTRLVFRIGIPFSVLFKQYDNWRDRIFMPLLGRFIYSRADMIIAVASGVADDIAQVFHLDRTKIAVIHTPKDIEAIQKMAKEDPVHPWLKEKRTPVILSIGRLSVQKDFATLLHAFARTRKEKEVKLVILGNDGGELKHLKILAKDLGIENDVDFLGFVKNPYALLARADLFVLTSRWEGLPNALVEALVCGTPSIATDCIGGGSRDILDPKGGEVKGVTEGEYGILVPTGDVKSLECALRAVFEDGKIREYYRTRAYRGAERFSKDSIIAKYKETLLTHEQNT